MRCTRAFLHSADITSRNTLGDIHPMPNIRLREDFKFLGLRKVLRDRWFGNSQCEVYPAKAQGVTPSELVKTCGFKEEESHRHSSYVTHYRQFSLESSRSYVLSTKPVIQLLRHFTIVGAVILGGI
jgi:hypothetical protein